MDGTLLKNTCSKQALKIATIQHGGHHAQHSDFGSLMLLTGLSIPTALEGDHSSIQKQEETEQVFPNFPILYSVYIVAFLRTPFLGFAVQHLLTAQK